MLNLFKTSEQTNKSADETIRPGNVSKDLQEFLSSFGIKCDYSNDKKTEEVAANNNRNAQP